MATDKQQTSKNQTEVKEEVKATAPKTQAKETPKTAAPTSSKEDKTTAPSKKEDAKVKETPKADESKKDAKTETPKANDSKKADKETSVADNKATDQPSEEPKVTTWHIDDISSPKLGKFGLKQKGKLIAYIEGEDKLKKAGFEPYDDTKFGKRNNYTDYVKYQIMTAIKDGKFNNDSTVFAWEGKDDKFPKVDIIPPEPKKTTNRSTSNQPKLEEPMDLGELNFGS